METIEDTTEGRWRLRTRFPDGREVSTVHLGSLRGSWRPGGDFETMVFAANGSVDQEHYDVRHKTRLAARTYHCDLVAALSE